MHAASALFRLLSDSTRLRLLRVLAVDRFNVTELTGILGVAQSSVSPASITITMGYSGKIGLADTNTGDSLYPYVEYRDKYLALGTSSDSVTQALTIGGGDGQ